MSTVAAAFAQTPPRVVDVTPDPRFMVVDVDGLSSVRLRFDTDVVVPPGAVQVFDGAAVVPGVTTEYDPATKTLTVRWQNSITASRVTIVADHSITGAGRPLDGEVANPDSPVLPSGDGLAGGQAVVRLNALMGDVNRDFVVNDADGELIIPAMGSARGEPDFNALADLNGDGYINVLDVAAYVAGYGASLPTGDGSAPVLAAITPDPAQDVTTPVEEIGVTFSEPIDAVRFDAGRLFVLNLAGDVLRPTGATLSSDGRAASFTFSPRLPRCDRYTVNLSNAVADASGVFLTRPATNPRLTGVSPPPLVTLESLPDVTMASAVQVRGSAPGAVRVEVLSPTGMVVSAEPGPDGAFAVSAPLAANRNNALFVTGISECGTRGSPVSGMVIQDMNGPSVYIEFPADNARPTDATVDVAGRIGDLLSGFMGLTVRVNGVAANVNVGIGTNGSFFAPAVPLNPIGQNTIIEAVATDRVGNTTTRRVTVVRAALEGPRMAAVSGNDQHGLVNGYVPDPIVVRVTNPDGTPFPNKIVTFDVDRNNGRVSPDGIAEPLDMIQVRTDSNGVARARWRLGGTAGMGNNRVKVTSTDIAGFIGFCASAGPGPASQINIGSGNNQVTEVGTPVAAPLVAWVSDSCNPIEGVSVTFRVVSGDGRVNGGSVAMATTTRTGHAAVNAVAGSAPGNTVIEANFAGNINGAAVFTVRGVLRDVERPTTLSGLMLDNASHPLQGATLTLSIGGRLIGSTQSDSQGQWRFSGFAGSGLAILDVNGATVNAVGGRSVPPNSYASLHFEPILVSNADNTMPMGPILLPPFNPMNTRDYSTTQDTVLTIEGIDGLEFLVRAGSMFLPDANGVLHPAPAGTHIALNQVHHDKVPMPMPDGVAPPFAWTLKPAGAVFDPPITIKYPNMTGMPPGGMAYFLSFNHTTARFDIIASGHVNADGSLIVTDPGSGLSIAGWGCNCPPYAVTADCCNMGCVNEGELSGGTVMSNASNGQVCPGDTVTWMIDGVVDSGGGKACPESQQSQQVPPGALTYSYEVRGPSGVVGSGVGPSAMVTLPVAGAYTCTFTATTERECPPSPRTLSSEPLSTGELSGAQWVSRFPGSSSTSDLVSPFQGNVNAFIDALRSAGASVTISATLRPPNRAFLMHYSYRVARDGLNPASVPRRNGVNICWLHTTANGGADLATSVQAAEAMVVGYNIAFAPALESRHTEGRAIDMTISWSGNLQIVDGNGTLVNITSVPRNGSGNTDLHAVGATFGVIKLASDPPHWSDDGH
ncbi:MAG: Ig-like domain-containing protein [Planctomycetes bacterium]|nr:Ig-like domain-containing protein [Planctomycetota bacterium]